VLKSLLITLALPPVGFLCLAILGLLIVRRRRQLGRWLVSLGLAGMTLLALPMFSDVLIVGLERDLPLRPPADAMPQAIVILGGDLTRTADPPFVLPGLLTEDRLRTGVALYRKTGLPILVTGGVVQPHHTAVAAVMADSLRDDFQVPVSWVEDSSDDTWENAEHSADILKKQGIRSVYVVTQGWHMRRAMLAFRHAGLIATAVPTSMEIPLDPIVWDFLPRASAWGWSYYALHEWIGCAWYAIR
jgi:uncharacterized SAM-binding protein YcdF (DUF218 family)